MNERRSFEELLDTADPAWPLVKSWAERATNPSEILPASTPQNRDALVATQVTTRSPMGAIIYETGGILVDHGWLRVLGSGHPSLPRSMPEWNKGRSFAEYGECPPFLLVADDAVGGFFALNGGAFGEERRKVYYYAPDALAWENMDVGYTEFLQWCFAGQTEKFYQDYRWEGWEREVSGLGGDQAFSIYPFPFAAGEPIAKRHRGVVPIAELYDLYVGGHA